VLLNAELALKQEKAMKRKKIVDSLLPGRYGRMEAAELDKEVAKFDQEFIADTAEALTQEERVRYQRARRKRGRPRVGNGANRVLITIESTLLRRSDAYAKKIGLTRSALIARGLEALLKKPPGETERLKE
jgi:hypothetical protein